MIPETCPWCGGPEAQTHDDGDTQYRCGSWTSMQGGSHQSDGCKDSELARIAARVAELEARCKRLEEVARAVYLDSIASDHPWTASETRNMRALRDVLEAKL